MELLKSHNWPVLPRESMKERSAAKEYSTSSNFKEHSPMMSAKKNILHTVQDTLASLLSFSPDVSTGQLCDFNNSIVAGLAMADGKIN